MNAGESQCDFFTCSGEENLVIFEDGNETEEAPYTRGRLKACANAWRGIGANELDMSWINEGFTLWFEYECPKMSLKNQESCFESEAAKSFIDMAMVKLAKRGIIGKWKKEWGTSHVVSPLKVVPKKGNTFRLILDLSRLNKYLMFPRFKYDSIKLVEEVFELGDWMFAWDLKDGYFHMDMASSMFTYMAFQWEGEIMYFVQCPNGLVPACWAFTKLVRAVMAHLRSMGLKCLGYIVDGLGGARIHATWLGD